VIERIEAAMSVLDIAGHEVGSVTEVRDDRVGVRLVGGQALWLTAEAFLSVQGSTVMLVCWRDRLGPYSSPSSPSDHEAAAG
jgi:hypothetical protein